MMATTTMTTDKLAHSRIVIAGCYRCVTQLVEHNISTAVPGSQPTTPVLTSKYSIANSVQYHSCQANMATARHGHWSVFSGWTAQLQVPGHGLTRRTTLCHVCCCACRLLPSPLNEAVLGLPQQTSADIVALSLHTLFKFFLPCARRCRGPTPPIEKPTPPIAGAAPAWRPCIAPGCGEDNMCGCSASSAAAVHALTIEQALSRLARAEAKF